MGELSFAPGVVATYVLAFVAGHLSRWVWNHWGGREVYKVKRGSDGRFK